MEDNYDLRLNICYLKDLEVIANDLNGIVARSKDQYFNITIYMNGLTDKDQAVVDKRAEIEQIEDKAKRKEAVEALNKLLFKDKLCQLCLEEKSLYVQSFEFFDDVKPNPDGTNAKLYVFNEDWNKYAKIKFTHDKTDGNTIRESIQTSADKKKGCFLQYKGDYGTLGNTNLNSVNISSVNIKAFCDMKNYYTPTIFKERKDFLSNTLKHKGLFRLLILLTSESLRFHFIAKYSDLWINSANVIDVNSSFCFIRGNKLQIKPIYDYMYKNSPPPPVTNDDERLNDLIRRCILSLWKKQNNIDFWTYTSSESDEVEAKIRDNNYGLSAKKREDAENVEENMIAKIVSLAKKYIKGDNSGFTDKPTAIAKLSKEYIKTNHTVKEEVMNTIVRDIEALFGITTAADGTKGGGSQQGIVANWESTTKGNPNQPNTLYHHLLWVKHQE